MKKDFSNPPDVPMYGRLACPMLLHRDIGEYIFQDIGIGLGEGEFITHSSADSCMGVL